MARSSTSWIPGRAHIPNAPLPERIAQRTIQEAFRGLADPVEIGRGLLDVWRGVDPTKGAIAKPPDGMPADAVPIVDWPHRLAAIKMFLEYSYGKPVQGVTVQAQIEATQRVQVETSHTQELRELASASPEVRELMRSLAAKLAGGGAPQPVLDVTTPSAPAIPVGFELDETEDLEGDDD